MSSTQFYSPVRMNADALLSNGVKVKTSDFNKAGKLAEEVPRRLNNSNSININMLMTPANSQNKSRSPSPTRPLINRIPDAPLAKLETDDEIDNREVVNRPYPGVDDGFFTNGDNGGPNSRIPQPPQDSGNPDVELVPTRAREPEDTNYDLPHIPSFSPRLGGDGDSENPDNTNEKQPPQPPSEAPKVPPTTSDPDFPFRPWGWDLEVGQTLPSGDTIPDLNVYQHKKTLAQGMMDLALFSANANQLRYILETFRTHPYYFPSLVLISFSLILQIGVGVGLIWNATFNVRNKQDLCTANKINNFTIIGVFLVTVINVFISAFGVAPPAT